MTRYDIRYRENCHYKVVKCTKSMIVKFIYDHTDFVILSVINAWRNKYFDRYECERLIDKVEAYYYAFEEDMIDCFQLYQKLNQEIMIEELHKNYWYCIGVYENDMY